MENIHAVNNKAWIGFEKSWNALPWSCAPKSLAHCSWCRHSGRSFVCPQAVHAARRLCAWPSSPEANCIKLYCQNWLERKLLMKILNSRCIVLMVQNCICIRLHFKICVKIEGAISGGKKFYNIGPRSLLGLSRLSRNSFLKFVRRIFSTRSCSVRSSRTKTSLNLRLSVRPRQKDHRTHFRLAKEKNGSSVAGVGAAVVAIYGLVLCT